MWVVPQTTHTHKHTHAHTQLDPYRRQAKVQSSAASFRQQTLVQVK